MNNDNIIRCKQCGQLNRILPHQSDQRPICRKCRSILEPSHQKIEPGSDLRNYRSLFLRLIPVIILLSLAIYLMTGGLKPENFTLTKPQGTVPTIQPMVKHSTPKEVPFTQPQQPLPGSGIVQRFTESELIARFKINGEKSSHYLIKLVDYYTKYPVLMIFVRMGDTVSVKVPFGTYEARFASGNNWYGFKYLFGPKTIYQKSYSEFEFEINGDLISGYEMTLNKVLHGNLHLSEINPEYF
jgi:hypothetical protein